MSSPEASALSPSKAQTSPRGEALEQVSHEALERARASGEVLQKRKDAMQQETSLRGIILQTVLGLVVVVGLVVVAATFFKAPLEAAAYWAVERFGIWGIVAGIAASDIFTSPIPPDTFLFIAAATKMPAAPTLTIVCITSLICGSISYFLGPQLRRIGFIHRRIERFRPRGEALFERWGVWTVAIGAMSPLPYSVTCWFAGIYRMPYRRFLLATLFRVPRIIAYYYLFVFGWA